MFIATTIILLPFLMVTFLPMVLKSFSSDELDQMGVQLDDSGMSIDPVQGSVCILAVNLACGSA